MMESSPKGVFSDKYLPREWVKHKFGNYSSEEYLQALTNICPGTHIVSRISRGSNSATFVLDGSEGLRICQFSFPHRDPASVSLEGELELTETLDISERLTYLRSFGIAVPRIISSGKVVIKDGQQEYRVMDFIRGVSADTFLAHHPNKNQEVYHQFGEMLAKLCTVPYIEKQGSANEHVLRKVEYSSDFLVKNQIFSSGCIRQLISVLQRKLTLLGDDKISYVHLDPFPANIQVTGGLDNFHITLIDIEAIHGGHPLVEGLGRAIKWGIYDWDYISGKLQYDTFSTIEAFLNGYSKIFPDVVRYTQSSTDLGLLLDVTDLVSLPQSIMKEHQKEKPATYYEWSKKRLLQLMEG